MEVVR